MTVTVTDFRKDLFKLLDSILESGKTLEINRNGQIIKVVPPQKQRKLDKLQAHPDAVVGDSDIDWSLDEVMPFAGIMDGETENLTIQELKAKKEVK